MLHYDRTIREPYRPLVRRRQPSLARRLRPHVDNVCRAAALGAVCGSAFAWLVYR